MGDFKLFNDIRSASHYADREINNHAALGLPADTRGVHILWMYPDVLNMHGSRGDAMALLHISNLMKLPCTIRRINTLTEDIPFDWADMMFFPSGDLSAVEDISKALLLRKAELQKFVDSGKVVLTVGSTGAVFGKGVHFLDGRKVKGLGLLDMVFRQRTRVNGNDLWISLPEGLELVGVQIQLADVKLKNGQEAFGEVKYGRGNNEDGTEGARTKNLIFTHLLGPLLVKNPKFTAELLLISAGFAGLDKENYILRDEDISLETASIEEIKTFIGRKVSGEIKW